jgi:SARP family transcriptional regulator, regulator of embCAB operon
LAGRDSPRTRIQLCGELVAEIEGRRIERRLPGRKGRLLFVYLVANRDRAITHDELVEAIWPDNVPPAVDGGLRALVSKVRRAVGQEALGLRNRFRLDLPVDAWIDLEAALEQLHRAEVGVAGGRWAQAWSSSIVGLVTARRGFLPNESGRWIDEWRRHLDEIEVRALECFTAASIGIGGFELPTAERCARELVGKEPYRESGYRLLMEALAKRGNCAEAIQVYEDLRRLLREELGISPSGATQELHKRLLREPAGAY